VHEAHRSELAALAARHAAQHEQTVNERELLLANHRSELEEAQRRHNDLIATHSRSLENVQSEHAAITQGHIRELEEAGRLREELLSKHSSELEAAAKRQQELVEEHSRELRRSSDHFEGKVVEHDSAIEKLKAEFTEQLEQLKAAHAAEVAELKSGHSSEYERLHGDHSTTLRELKDGHSKEFEDLKASHLTSTELLKNEHVSELQKLRQELDETRATHKTISSERDLAHSNAIEKLTAELSILKSASHGTEGELETTKAALVASQTANSELNVKLNDLQLRFEAATDSARSAVDNKDKEITALTVTLAEVKNELLAVEKDRALHREARLKDGEQREEELREARSEIEALKLKLKVFFIIGDAKLQEIESAKDQEFEQERLKLNQDREDALGFHMSTWDAEKRGLQETFSSKIKEYEGRISYIQRDSEAKAAAEEAARQMLMASHEAYIADITAEKEKAIAELKAQNAAREKKLQDDLEAINEAFAASQNKLMVLRLSYKKSNVRKFKRRQMQMTASIKLNCRCVPVPRDQSLQKV